VHSKVTGATSSRQAGSAAGAEVAPRPPSSLPPLPPLLVLGAAGPPYDLSPEFVDELFSKHKIDYIIHGDDPCLLPDGSDAYAHAKKLGRFKMVRPWQLFSNLTLQPASLMTYLGAACPSCHLCFCVYTY
jgi:hypothetical protein